MTLGRLMAAEIGFRKGAFALGCVSVAIALAALSGSQAMLRAHDWRTERLIEQKETETREAMARMEDDYRVIMKRMGYNVMVLAADEDLDALRLRGYAVGTMPAEYAERLAASGLMSLNHLLPVLQRQIVWPETGETILLCGVRGQMPLAGRRGERAPIQAPIPPGRLALGQALAARIDVTAGETVTLMGETFTVERVEPARGSIDDLAVWVALDQVQHWLKAPGLISGILALECVCHADSLGQIVGQVTALLPGVQVFEFSSKVQGRAEARQRAAETSRQAIAAEQEQRRRLRAERARLAATVSGLAIGGAMLWILLLAYGNARDRQGEIGMLRAVGMPRRQIVVLLLGKAVLMGVCGGAAGVALGWGCGAWAARVPLAGTAAWELAGGWRLFLVWLTGPLLAGGAACWPSLAAARRDPADILGKE